MKHLNIKIVLTGITLFMVSALMQSCSTDVGGNEDRAAGTITLTSLHDGNGGLDVVGTSISPGTTTNQIAARWILNYPVTPGKTLIPSSQSTQPITARYAWDTNSVLDCRRCRIRITGTDVVGNVTAPADSTENFVVNNVPQVLGAALYFDSGNDGVGDGDTITIPFDKEIELLASVAADVFVTPVVGDEIGPFSTLDVGATSTEVVIKINALVGPVFHLHMGGRFDAGKRGRTAPSGLDILENLAGEVIFAKDTGRTAEPLGDGIDIVPVFGAGQVIGNAATLAIAMGDINEDGTLDMLAINVGTSQAVFSNDGTGFFGSIATNPLMGSSANTSVALGDLNGDDVLDAVVGNTGGNLVYTNNGSGTGVFTDTGQSIDANTQSVALGDIDGDGDLDLVTGNREGTASKVWINNMINSGVFVDSTQALGTNDDTESIALADVDGDGDLDIVAGNNNAQANKVYINTGINSGTFTDSGQSLGDSFTRAIMLGDIDGDSDMDLVTGNANQSNRVWINDGTGVFTDSGQALGSELTYAVILSDVDGDNDLDFIMGNSVLAQTNQIWFNDGSGVFSNSRQSLGAIATLSMGIADIDGDGDEDLVTAGFGTPDLVWTNALRHPSQPSFQNSGQALGVGLTTDVAVKDVDADGDVDLITGNDLGEPNRVYINNGLGVLSDSNQSLGSNDTESVVIGDIDGNGSPDLVTGNFFQPNRVWHNDGSGGFSEDVPAQMLGTNATASLALTDVDGDADLDLIEGIRFAANRVWLNNAGVFSDSGLSLGTTEETRSIAVGDLDGINGVDIVAGNNGNNVVYFNDGAGDYSMGGLMTFGGSNTRAVKLGDVDGDGDLDVVTGNFSQANKVWINNAGVLADSNQVLGIGSTAALELLDIDGDKDLDVVIANTSGQANTVWLNDGKGKFTATADAIGSNDTESVVAADMDADGDFDLVTGNNNAQPNQLWLNDY